MALKTNEGVNVVEKVVVAVKASKDISKTALVWALTHVAHPGDCITFLIVLPDQTSGRKIWGFPRFAGDCANGHKKFHSGASLDLKSDITDYCTRMMIQLHDMYDPHKINVKIKIVSGSPCGEVAIESKRIQANWVILDRQLKHEQKRCMEELQSNIVVIKHSRPKVLRLNLVASPQEETQSDFSKKETTNLERGPNVTPTSSPEVGTLFTGTETGTASISSSDPGTSPIFALEKDYEVKKEDNFLESKLGVRNIDFSMNVGLSNNKTTLGKALMEKFCKLDIEAGTLMLNHRQVMDFNANVRRAPPGPPPLCSVCQYKAPMFGKPPRSFSYAELKHYTDGFSQGNFLAEGGFGSVYKGILPDGQAVAVKQHKLASSQGDLEFCSEVEVLSCAQHRNVVTLIGFCVEDRRRLLVYEYICNGSLDSYLYGQNCQPLEWEARQRIAIGAARGLRYLHEECRVGCIVHRDMRPSNILITHDFEPLVGDFGLARWQPNGNLGVDTRVIGTFGYLAPEYTQSGQITEKADVYSFGVVLVELVTGRKAVDINRPRGQQFLTEWARPLLERMAIEQLVDPRLENRYSESDVHCMLRAASLCIHRDPHVRPRMSQVIRILEGDMIAELPNFSSTPAHEGWWRQWAQRAEHEQQSGHHSNGEIMHMPSKIYCGRLS